jgi:hypothetical protein
LSLSVVKLDSHTTLEKYKNRILKNLKDSEPDVKDIVMLNTTLSGEPAYRFEYMIRLLDHWEKSIDIDSLRDGKLYDVSALGTPEAIEEYSNEINSMLESVKFN